MRRMTGEAECELVKSESRHVLRISTKIDIAGNLSDCIADIVITDCKTYYINERIKLPIGDNLVACAFTSALSTFDRDTDKIIAKTLIRLTPQINLDSFYEFGLYVLKSRWDEVCLLANENRCYLLCQSTFMELLRFLISNIDGMCDEAHIVMNGERLEVLGGGLKPIENIYINDSLPNDIQIVNKLVVLAPKRIFLHTANDALKDSIQNIFGTCTVVN